MPTDAVYALRAPKVFMMAEVPNSKITNEVLAKEGLRQRLAVSSLEVHPSLMGFR